MVKGQDTQSQKILILTAIPHGLRLDKEIKEIEECIRRAAKRDKFEIRLRTAVCPQDIRRAFAEERPHIVHFCGHGLEDGSLLLEDDGGRNKPVKPEGLAQLFKLHADYVQCVLLNACHSAKSATAISQYINYAIGMNQEIQDKAAIAFSQGFYDALGYDYPDNLDVFQRAFDEALVAIQLEDISQSQIPVLQINQQSMQSASVNNSPINNPSIATKQELDDQDIETLRELLQLSGRAAADRRKALCIEIGINSGDLSAIWMLSENDFAIELIDLLHKRKLENSIYKLCKKLVSDFQQGAYHSKLRVIMTKIKP
ncbi:CHAT domain-containing protein [Nostoc sp. ChiQUE01b]|uniref:CHAT domain-containing protein n=1 Tax=Nostoc sp. ChiQUE01b TaxID=3075376 RepID=UPI002AD45346|nr:CHAT domain-containing protein [Nostoc sp. ChiQUE01b]MDZ8264431.1 CHAT domain-containing protein [Nostoc sp. ChiQUE01b]